jgi:hypothetical protein
LDRVRKRNQRFLNRERRHQNRISNCVGSELARTGPTTDHDRGQETRPAHHCLIDQRQTPVVADRTKAFSLRCVQGVYPRGAGVAAPVPSRPPRDRRYCGSSTRLLLRTRRPPQITSSMFLVHAGSSPFATPTRIRAFQQDRCCGPCSILEQARVRARLLRDSSSDRLPFRFVGSDS